MSGTKKGGVCWNRSLNHKAGISTRFKCEYCGREYKQGWTRANHEKLCNEGTR